ncbi:3-methyl-2-oxobutanoate hydroxymethyltransferase [Moraxella catarrhalis]|uniref:3-methyl-2-oxobutanoate hydroxymethyltransferase n=1 Tax=Moraxella catarrhalis TaxID=480 RepID=A0A198UH15_MORCA|nr:3-methyl-2-oxobutanoate hydroxymethyltransferase [Moraxella catarrhalis]OAU94988.1 3-methyl-2-oxobutanoate hydroxymethyltransferase [Moraxella catarrhalis]OAU95738.1 3-methyl-2-oxobutanoate hydroxymethyltransferase [Moraxella catarrhalis]OAU97154.1 3-methyl-2-oxobutanoate hydroxymethyltransferase [Moraxella catarrhalis]
MTYLADKPKVPITLSTLNKYKATGEKFSCLTCYDASFAASMQAAGVDSILVGDSLGMVVQGQVSTLPVTVADMVYHTENVARANTHALIMTDLPFMSYATVSDAIASAKAVMQAGANVVKIEGGSELSDTVKVLTNNGVPVCVHLGLTPQSVNVFGGYKVQGKTDEAANRLIEDCHAVTAAGAAVLLLECVPAELAKTITQSVDVPVIGIGAGVDTDGQVLVMHDILGVYTRKPAKFVKNFLTDPKNASRSIQGAFELYHEEVKQKAFPTPAHSFL